MPTILPGDIKDFEKGRIVQTPDGEYAVRVYVDPSSGLIKNDFFAAGSDGTGSDGDTDRVYTLDNTSTTTSVRVHLTQEGMVTNTLVPSSGFTVSHQATGTLVTIKVAVYDADTVWFEYY